MDNEIRHYPKEEGHEINTIPDVEGYVSTGRVKTDFYGSWYEYVKGSGVAWIIGDDPEPSEYECPECGNFHETVQGLTLCCPILDQGGETKECEWCGGQMPEGDAGLCSDICTEESELPEGELI